MSLNLAILLNSFLMSFERHDVWHLNDDKYVQKLC
jgi:hypothetical protein